MTALNLDTAKDLYYTDIIYQIHTIHDKIRRYESKYKTEFRSFEVQTKEKERENFEEWDDYLDWKGLQMALGSL